MLHLCMFVSRTNKSVETFDGFFVTLIRKVRSIGLIEQRTLIFLSNGNKSDARTYEVGGDNRAIFVPRSNLS